MAPAGLQDVVEGTEIWKGEAGSYMAIWGGWEGLNEPVALCLAAHPDFRALSMCDLVIFFPQNNGKTKGKEGQPSPPLGA